MIFCFADIKLFVRLLKFLETDIVTSNHICLRKATAWCITCLDL